MNFDESGVVKRLPEMMADAGFNAENSLNPEEKVGVVRQGNERGVKENRKGEIASWCWEFHGTCLVAVLRSRMRLSNLVSRLTVLMFSAVSGRSKSSI